MFEGRCESLDRGTKTL